MIRANLAATLKAKEEGKNVAYAFIQDGHKEIPQAMPTPMDTGDAMNTMASITFMQGSLHS